MDWQKALSDYSQLLEGYPNAKRFAQALRGNIDKNVPTKEDLENPEKRYEFAMNAAANAPMGLAIKAYHGTPHSFDRFDMSKIGTGEGAQAYGHGLYFAESPSVADEYRRATSSLHGAQEAEFFDKAGNKLPDIKFGHPEYIARTALHANEGNYQKAIDQIKNEIKEAQNSSSPFLLSMAEGNLRNLKILEDMQKQGVTVSAPKGNLYNVSLEWPDAAREAVDPLSPEHFLNWDKPLSEQPEIIQEKFASLKPFNTKLTMAGDPYTDLSVSGSDVYNYLYDAYKNPERASKLLKDVGIPGIRYLDQGSRGAGEGTSNYVVFSDQIPRIVEKLRGNQ